MYSKYTGVILKKHPLGEADELLTIYTRQAGKLRAKAVAVRRIQSKLAGNLGTLNEIDFEVALARRSLGEGGGLPVLVSVRPRAINAYLREDLKKFAHALVGVETLYRLTPDEEPNEAIYEALVSFLKNLGETADQNAEVRKFQLALLAASGYRGIKVDALDHFLQEVLEREIKSRRFLETLSE